MSHSAASCWSDLEEGRNLKTGTSRLMNWSQGCKSQETLLPQSNAVCQNSFRVVPWPVWQRHISLQAQRWPWAARVAVVQASRQWQGWLQGQHFAPPDVTRMSQNKEENLEDVLSLLIIPQVWSRHLLSMRHQGGKSASAGISKLFLPYWNRSSLGEEKLPMTSQEINEGYTAR